MGRGVEGGAGQGAPPPPPVSKDIASLVLRSQGGLSADVPKDKRHLKIAQSDGVGKLRQESAGGPVGADFSPARP